MYPDAAELMHHHTATQDHMVFDGNMPAQRHQVRKHCMAANLAIVREMDVGHGPVVVANARDAHVLRRSRVEGAELPDGVVIADLQAGWLAAVLLVLRAFTERHELEDTVASPDAGVAGD